MANTESNRASRTQSKRLYNEKNYQRIYLTVAMGEKEKIQEFADQHNESINGFINRAIRETMERDTINN